MLQNLELVFRFCMYVLFGLTLETVYAVTGIERSVGAAIPRRVPKKYLEGFVSLYMIPIHGFGMLFGYEAIHGLIMDWAWPFRYLVWCLLIAGAEVVGGYVYLKILGFYSWDYYKLSPYKVFKEGLTLWTLVPQWGIAGLIMEFYSQMLKFLSPFAAQFIQQYFNL